MKSDDKPLVWLHGEIQSPPFSTEARLEAGFLLRKLQMGESLGMPQSRPMPSIGARVHELRINDRAKTRRIIYRQDSDAIIIAEIFSKETRKTPKHVIETCKERLSRYDQVAGDG
jgi:phage-related protein